MKTQQQRIIRTFLLLAVFTGASAKILHPLIDARGKIQSDIPVLENAPAIVSVVTTTPSCVIRDDTADAPLSLLQDSDETTSTLLCTGATATTADVTCLATCSVVSDVIVLDGLTAADVHRLVSSRHARTLTALFRARLHVDGGDSMGRQTLVLAVQGDAFDASTVQADVQALWEAAALEQSGTINKNSFAAMYQVQVQSVSPESGSAILTQAQQLAQQLAGTRPSQPLSQRVATAVRTVSAVGTPDGLDTADAAAAFLAVLTAHTTAQRTARVQWSAWKQRAQRGLCIDQFGTHAAAFSRTVLAAWDRATLAAAGLPAVAAHRMELRRQLEQFVESAITNVYQLQMDHLQTTAVKRLQRELLKSMDNTGTSVETMMNANAAAVRKLTFWFETLVADLEVPSLGLTKEKAVRDLAPQLQTVVDTFPDSPLAQLQRSKRIQKVVSKQKKPGTKGINWGMDLVAVLRPDGYGTLQGYCGYQLPFGHSVTFGVHNDADDPSVLSQFGGVRPPLLRIQPKLRLDVEL